MTKRTNLPSRSQFVRDCRGAAHRLAELQLPPNDDPCAASYAVACALFEHFLQIRVNANAVPACPEPVDCILQSARSEIAPILERVRLELDEQSHGSDSDVVRPEALAAIYESAGAGRQKGSYYTPGSVAQLMTLRALERYLSTNLPEESEAGIRLLIHQGDVRGLSDRARVASALTRVRVLDPACGGGAFLVAAFTELKRLFSALRDGIPPADEAILRSIHGLDSDPRAAAIARMRLSLACDAPLCSLERSVRQADAFDMCEQDGTFDIVLANPPYVSTYARGSAVVDGEVDLRTRYPEVGGRLNTFGCFLMRAMEFVGSNGVLAFIVPDVLAYANSYSGLRRTLAERMPRQEWMMLDWPVFDAAVRNVVLVASPGDMSVNTSVISGVEDAWSSTVKSDPTPTRGGLDLCNPTPCRGGLEPGVPSPRRGGLGWGLDGVRFFRSSVDSDVWAHLQSFTHQVNDFFSVKDGVNPGPAVCRAMILSAVDPQEPCARRYIEGKDIDPDGWFVTPPDKWLRYDQRLKNRANAAMGFSLRNAGVFQSPKLVSRQTADTLVVALDESDDLVTLNSVHCIRSRNGNTDELLALLAVLNSPLARLFYAIDSGETRDVLPQVHISWLVRFPLPDNFSQVATMLAGLARGVLAGDENARTRLHGVVCEAYHVPSELVDPIFAAYLERYRRFRSSARGLRLGEVN